MKKKKHCKRSLAAFLAISICLCCISVSNVSASVVKAENDLQEKRSVEQATLPENIQSLIPEEKRGDLVVTASTDTDNAEMCTIRTENPETGEGTLFVHSSPIKYKDKNGDIHFIDTSMETISAKAKTNSGYAYRNAANSFTVEYGKTTDIGINFDEAFTVVPVNNAPLERAETANASASAARPMSENGNGKLRYDGVFGSDTHVEYVNTTNGIKETIILDRYTGTDRFDFIFRSKTHIPLLAEGGAYILVAPKDKPEEPEYRFLSLYAYDAYEPDGTASTFRHMNEDLYYELTSNTDGSFIISVVVPDGYLTHPDIVYPVTIDPSVQKVANNSNVHDTYVNEAAPTTQSYYNYDYIRFGSSNGKRMFGYIRYTELPALPTGATVTSANLKFTFRSGQNTPTATAGVSFMSLRVTAHQWNESSITWNNQPYGTEGTFTSFHYNGKYLDYVTADMTDMIRAWTSGAANYGIDFTYTDEEYNDYNSVVSSEGDADRAPVMTVNYVVYGSTSGITSGETYFIKNVYSGKYLGADQNLNNNVLQYTYHGKANQQWRVLYQGNGLYKLYNHYSFYSENKYCLDLESISNNNIDLYYDSSSDYVLFNIISNGDGTYRIQNYWPKGTAVITVGDASSLSNAYNSEWTGSSKQKWVFEKRYTKAVTAHSGKLTVGMSADNYGNSSSDYNCTYGFRVSTHTANGFWSGLSSNTNIDLSFYNFNYGNSHSYTWATKNDFLSKNTYIITTPNIDDVNFMLFVGHGLGKNLHFSHGPQGTNHSSNKSNHSIQDLNFSLNEAKFGYGTASTKWVFLYTCNFINESSLNNVKSMMMGCNIVMGYHGSAYLNEPQGTQIGKNLREGRTVINSFFSTRDIHIQYAGFPTTARAVYVNDAYGDTLYRHLQYAGTYITEDIRMAYSTWE